MEYPIALPPDLGLDVAGFVTAWNETPECSAVAKARLETTRGAQFSLGAATAVLGSVAASVAGAALYDSIKRLMARQGVRERMDVTRVDQPDGTQVLVVTVVKE